MLHDPAVFIISKIYFSTKPMVILSFSTPAAFQLRPHCTYISTEIHEDWWRTFSYRTPKQQPQTALSFVFAHLLLQTAHPPLIQLNLHHSYSKHIFL